LGERLLCKQEVDGSIPFTSTTDPASAGVAPRQGQLVAPGAAWSRERLSRFAMQTAGAASDDRSRDRLGIGESRVCRRVSSLAIDL
jgi:hypothetical protein